jgi:hypothetical protein
MARYLNSRIFDRFLSDCLNSVSSTRNLPHEWRLAKSELKLLEFICIAL